MHPRPGIPELRAAIAAKPARGNDLHVDPEQVRVTAAGMQALHQVLSLILEAGDEVLVPDPGYANSSTTARHVGAVPVPYRLDPDDGFHPDPAARGLRLPADAGPARGLPVEPAGTVHPAAVLEQPLQFTRRHDLRVVSDEAARTVHVRRPARATASLDPDGRVLPVFSSSTTCALTGWFVAPLDRAPLLRTAQEAVVSCVDAPAREHHRATIEAVCEVLHGNGTRFQRPQRSLHLRVDVSHVPGDDVATWCERFLLERRVAVVPTPVGRGGSGHPWPGPATTCCSVRRGSRPPGVHQA